ncbi:hypothetical protein [Sphingomonas crocodyli]|nr:hypothetical protein [Sphingomonas crocodyli]
MNRVDSSADEVVIEILALDRGGARLWGMSASPHSSLRGAAGDAAIQARI